MKFKSRNIGLNLGPDPFQKPVLWQNLCLNIFHDRFCMRERNQYHRLLLLSLILLFSPSLWLPMSTSPIQVQIFPLGSPSKWSRLTTSKSRILCSWLSTLVFIPIERPVQDLISIWLFLYPHSKGNFFRFFYVLSKAKARYLLWGLTLPRWTHLRDSIFSLWLTLGINSSA